MAYGTRVQFEAVREVGFGSISGSYSTVGSPLADHARIIRFVNTTDADVYISSDGTTNNIRLAPNSFILLDFSTNKIRDDGLFVSINTQFWVKQQSGAPTKGAVWLEVIYAIRGV